jgi:hypothetical protein
VQVPLHIEPTQTQLPDSQTWAIPQTFPQVPQFSGSTSGFVQLPEHSIPGQVQVLFTHISFVPQAFPQVPQLVLSVVVSTQASPHAVWPPGHWHTPPTHVAVGGQKLSQAPQLCGSLFSSTQVPLQIVSLPGQTQCQEAQVASGGQTLLQAPQLSGSVEGFVQPSSHPSGVSPGQQVPFRQLVPPQPLPQAPQLFGSLSSFTHTLLHATYGLKQMFPFVVHETPGGQGVGTASLIVPQNPFIHGSFAGHTFPQAPQFELSDVRSVQTPAHWNSPPGQNNESQPDAPARARAMPARHRE